MAKTLWVKAAADDGRVVLWEQDDDHPDGEAWVASQEPVEVADTLAVKRLLRDGELVEVSARDARKEQQAKDEGKEPQGGGAA